MYYVLAFVIGGILFFLLMTYIVRGLQRRKLNEVLQRFPHESILRISSGANFFGLESQGYGQVRGNGVLILTRDTLHFEMLLPRKVLTIPTDRILSVEKVSSHLGRRCAWPLLKVSFHSETGPDSAAWALRKLDEWIAHVATIAGRTPQESL